MAQTFDRSYEEQIETTAMVTANPHSDSVLRKRKEPPQHVATPLIWADWDPVTPDAFASLDEVFEYGWDEELKTVPPQTVTGRAVDAGRTGDHDRLVVHYLQPHAPYIADVGGNISTVYSEPINSLQRGDVSKDTVWNAYLDNLRLVLSEVELLLDNLDADRVAITADHGEAFGEAGLYEHPICCPHPVVKKVPWVETTATDSGEYQPEGVTAKTKRGTSVKSERDIARTVPDTAGQKFVKIFDPTGVEIRSRFSVRQYEPSLAVCA